MDLGRKVMGSTVMLGILDLVAEGLGVDLILLELELELELEVMTLGGNKEKEMARDKDLKNTRRRAKERDRDMNMNKNQNEDNLIDETPKDHEKDKEDHNWILWRVVNISIENIFGNQEQDHQLITQEDHHLWNRTTLTQNEDNSLIIPHLEPSLNIANQRLGNAQDPDLSVSLFPFLSL